MKASYIMIAALIAVLLFSGGCIQASQEASKDGGLKLPDKQSAGAPPLPPDTDSSSEVPPIPPIPG